MAERIQLRRTAGWQKPANAIVVSRPTKWGNPFQIDSNRLYVVVHDGTTIRWTAPRSDDDVDLARGRATSLYRSWLDTDDIRTLCNSDTVTELPDVLSVQRRQILGDLRSLADHDLACWCPLTAPCHADVLLELANEVAA